jgi:hypothetical protein
MDALAVQLDCARVGLVQEAESRGVVDQSPSPSVTEWLLEHCFHLEPADAARTVDLARLRQQPRNQVMAAAVSGGTVTVRKAMTALCQLGQVEHALEPGKRQEALASLTQMAQTGYDRHVLAIGRTLMSLVGAERALERDETVLRALSSLRLSPQENVVLGSQSQPLDVGRTKRLVTPALLAAIWARDRGCTYPGCGRPPQWTDAHHVKHWIEGGPTALLNLALLCAHHHTWVHQHDLTATVTALDVTWQT